MKKYKGLIFLFGNVFISLLIYIGLFLLELPKGIDILWCVLLQILGAFFGVFFFIFFHEFGHFVFGKISGYEFVFFRVGPLEIKKLDNEKIKVSFSFSNTLVLGQCLMAPPKPQKKKKPKFYLYNAGGLIFSYLLDVILIVLYLLISVSIFRWIILPMILIGVFLSINNSIYLEYGVNDVCNHINCKKNPKYIDAILYQLAMVGNVIKGKRYGAKVNYVGYYENPLNNITVSSAQFMFYQAIDRGNFSEAEEIIKVITSSYHNLPIYIQRVAVIFEILWADIVLFTDMNRFKRHYHWIGVKERMFCQKINSDIKKNYDIYTSIFEGKYDIKELVNELFESGIYKDGELLSIKKKFNYLTEKLDFYIKNGNSFVVRGDDDEVF